MTDSILSTFTASDGDNIALQEWPLPDGVPLRGAVVLVHGLGEHAGRYDHVARRLNSWGFAVRGYDQYGHGESGGPRGGCPTTTGCWWTWPMWWTPHASACPTGCR
jgi:alpha-beta hydrolase superfamily lysophospholipase